MSVSERENSTKIVVKMFGEFSIRIGKNQITNLKGRTKRVWMLIQYLIARRYQPVALSRLLSDIWDDKSCGDPENALKNLVYRARVLLRDLSGSSKNQFIIFMNDTYLWNNQYECEVDAEQFELLCREAENQENPAETRIELYQKALSLYNGHFLPKSVYSKWAVVLDTHYSNLYLKSAQSLCALLDERQQFSDVISVCRGTLRYFPYEEPVHRTILEAYVNAGQRERAFEHYNRATELFYEQFGVDLSKKFLPYYKRLIRNGSKIEQSLSEIKGDLQEASDASGAYFCDYDIFKSIYRSQSRMISRTGQSVFLALFTLNGPQGEAPRSEAARSASEKLKTVAIENLRKGDTVASFNATQLIVLLPLTTFESVQSITSRIIRRFHFEYRKSNVRLTAKISPLSALES